MNAREEEIASEIMAAIPDIVKCVVDLNVKYRNQVIPGMSVRIGSVERAFLYWPVNWTGEAADLIKDIGRHRAAGIFVEAAA